MCPLGGIVPFNKLQCTERNLNKEILACESHLQISDTYQDLFPNGSETIQFFTAYMFTMHFRHVSKKRELGHLCLVV